MNESTMSLALIVVLFSVLVAFGVFYFMKLEMIAKELREKEEQEKKLIKIPIRVENDRRKFFR